MRIILIQIPIYDQTFFLLQSHWIIWSKGIGIEFFGNYLQCCFYNYVMEVRQIDNRDIAWKHFYCCPSVLNNSETLKRSWQIIGRGCGRNVLSRILSEIFRPLRNLLWNSGEQMSIVWLNKGFFEKKVNGGTINWYDLKNGSEMKFENKYNLLNNGPF